MDEIFLTLRRSTASRRDRQIRLSGTLQLKSSASDCSKVLALLGRLHEPMCVVLPAESPWSWLELWAEDIGIAEDHLSLRFLLPRRESGKAAK
jgi:hypothetical protein